MSETPAEGSAQTAERQLQPVTEGQPQRAQQPGPTVICDNVLGARTDLELRNILNDNRGKTVVVDFGSAFCSHCKEMLPHFLTASAKYPKQQFVVASLDYMNVEAEGIVYTPTIAVYRKGKKVDSFYGSNAQRLDDHLWLHSDD